MLDNFLSDDKEIPDDDATNDKVSQQDVITTDIENGHEPNLTKPDSAPVLDNQTVQKVEECSVPAAQNVVVDEKVETSSKNEVVNEQV